ncbi:CHAT domain-containing protein [Geopyxis carbonaria]|nr:CHAT domain-containing protein [Geopyxis carbonaria]
MTGCTLTNMAYYSEKIWEESHQLDDIEDCIRICTLYVDDIPNQLDEEAYRIHFLLRARIARFQNGGEDLNTEDFTQDCMRMIDSKHSPPQHRIQGAFLAKSHLENLHLLEKCSYILEKAVHLLPLIVHRFLARFDLEFALSEHSTPDLGLQAASISLAAGRTPYTALSLLEIGRGVIMGLLLDLRSDVDELQLFHPELHQQFVDLRRVVGQEVGNKRHLKDVVIANWDSQGWADLEFEPVLAELRDVTIANWDSQRGAALEFETLLTEIRQQPGYSRFLLPPLAEKIQKLAYDGPIVLFVCPEKRSHAIIVQKKSIDSIELKGFQATELAKKMKKIKPAKRNEQNKMWQELLIWLWNVAVSPILSFLDFQPVKDGVEPPRIWWIGCGILGGVPFHAAGDHSRNSTQNTISRAVSSYIPTLRALSYAREKDFSLQLSQDETMTPATRAMFVSMPTTPGLGTLDGVPKEVSNVTNILPESCHKTAMLHPSVEDVLEQLPNNDIVHFACHGMSDALSPSDSRLILQRGNPPEQDPLTAQNVAEAGRSTNAKLAYISACCSAKNDSQELTDEAIHIASAFQLAGFSHVLATLWESGDDACVNVATGFYKRLFEIHAQSSSLEGHAGVARAFHEAVKEERKNRPKNIMGWAPFIHTGA